MVEVSQNARKQVGASKLRQPEGDRPNKRGNRSHIYTQGRLDVHPSAPEGVGGHYVYLVQDAAGLVKVGITESVLSRHYALHDLIPVEHRPIRLIRAVRMASEMAYKAERIAHKRLGQYWADYRGFTEWFKTSTRIAGQALRHAIREAEPVR